MINTVGEFVRTRRKAGQSDAARAWRIGWRRHSVCFGIGTRQKIVAIDVVDRVLAVFGKRLGIADAPKKDDA